MLSWAIIFLSVSLISGLFAFAGIAGASAGVAQVLALVFAGLFVGAVALDAARDS
ncbi:DUF1328 domain-containing protein [Jannaschia sp. S6380]|uniref:DUF1328 domain-containing protein n=1 Tax=Jannaschia sp. S6380 TaxID=2926408 RepID=UPI001FF5890D|nr:DUF1328 domain-containing protein [Jannaschia sp. S6380]MCK0167191.1 DUF1328 domain-containing protein [Jannaschia sp. S6380]